MDVYVVERYATGLTPEVLRAAAVRMARASGILYVGSVLIPGDEGSLCLFIADSAAACHDAAEGEGTPFARVVGAELIRPQT